ncbi:MAG: OsmC family protein [Anaerolineales bacterium]|jgi:putative redox protein
MSTITLRWIEEKLMMASDSNGHSVVIGRSPEKKFEWEGVKPSDMLLMSVASCSAYDVVEILAKQREPLEDLKVICNGDQESEPPYIFTRIHIHYIVKGQVNPEKLKKAIKLSEDKYCSVINTLRPTVPITSEFEIISSI